MFNNGLCPNWHYAGKDDPDCGRLPWLFNVEAAHYESKITIMIKMFIVLSCYRTPWMHLENQKIFTSTQFRRFFCLKQIRIVLKMKLFG